MINEGEVETPFSGAFYVSQVLRRRATWSRMSDDNAAKPEMGTRSGGS